jgi:hypothetical protein
MIRIAAIAALIIIVFVSVVIFWPEELKPPSNLTEIGRPLALGLTYHNLDGNRVVSGRGSLPSSEPIDIGLDGRPRWLVAVPHPGGGSVWIVVLDGGRVQGFLLSGGGYRTIEVEPEQLPPEMPPLILISNGTPKVLLPPGTSDSQKTHPIVIENKSIAFIEGGDIVFWNDTEIQRLDIEALDDARVLMDEEKRLLVLAGPSGDYRHGVLGDDIEASGFVMMEPGEEGYGVSLSASVPGGKVIEGLMPIWADVDGDRSREIIVTVSDAEGGAQILVYSEKGSIIARGPPIGRGFRWRHQIAIGPVGPNGETELVVVLTPHIGGEVEYYRLEGKDLRIVAKIGGYTSHVYGSRNLDMAAVGDFDGDGSLELLLPNQDRTELGAIRRNLGGAEVAWSLRVGGVVTTNLAVYPSDEAMSVGVGREDGVLRIWAS